MTNNLSRGKPLHGSYPSDCSNQILSALASSQMTFDELLAKLNYRWCRRTMYYHINTLCRDGIVERVLTVNGFRKLEFRVKRK